MRYWNSTLKNMDEYVPGEQPLDMDSYIKLNTNENPFPPAPAVFERISEALNDNLKRYPDSRAQKVRETFAGQNNLLPDNIFVGNGSDEIFTLIFRGFIERDGVAAFPYPSYSLYDTLAQGNGIKFKKIELGKDFSLDLSKFLEAKYDLVIIANPNNPTGRSTPHEEIRAFLDKYQGLLVVDEAYIDFYGGSCAKLVEEYDNLIVTRSFSKSYSLAGLRIGLAIACPEIIRGFLKIKDSYNIDTLAIEAAVAALESTKAFNYNRDMMRNNKEYLEESMEAMGFEIVPSQANFIFTKHPDIPSKELQEQLKEHKILVRHFTGPIQEDYIRITIGTMMEVKKLCSTLASILKAK